jgi:hypothetical protein
MAWLSRMMFLSQIPAEAVEGVNGAAVALSAVPEEQCLRLLTEWFAAAP